MLRQAIIDRVVVRSVRDKNVCLTLDARRQIKRAGHDTDRRRVFVTPEQTGAAAIAESARCLGGRLIPLQAIIDRNSQMFAHARGCCAVMTAGLSALRAMAENNAAQWSIDVVFDAATQACAASFSRLLR